MGSLRRYPYWLLPSTYPNGSLVIHRPRSESYIAIERSVRTNIRNSPSKVITRRRDIVASFMEMVTGFVGNGLRIDTRSGAAMNWVHPIDLHEKNASPSFVIRFR